jgi:D-xylose ABC transporter substrate-binding protein
MKHINRLLMIIATIVFVFGCNQKPKIGFLMDDVKIERWKKDRDLFVEKVTELGGIPLVEIAGSDANLQLEQAITLLNKGVEVLVVVPVDQDAAAEIVRVAHKAEVPVISYDRLIKNCNLDFYVSTDNIEIGELQANYLTKSCPIGKYGLIGGPTTDNNAFLLHLGWNNILQPLIDKGDIILVFDEYCNAWNADDAYKIVRDYLELKPEIDAIIAGNDVLASGAIQALKDFHLEGRVLIAGQDADLLALRNIVAGNQTITIYKPIESIASNAAMAAIKMANGDNPMENMCITVNNGRKLVPSLLLNARVVNRQNIRMTVVSEGFMAE